MALVLRINNMDEFYEMTHFARKPYYNQLDFQCTRRLFALTVSRPSHQGRCFIELRLQAPFFPNYAVSPDQIVLHRAISPQQFFVTFLQMKRCGFDYLIFTLSHLLDSLKLSFCNISDPHDPLDVPYHLYFPFLPTNQHLDLNRTPSTTFVLFPSFILQSMLASSNDSHVTLFVTLTASQAKFIRRDIGRNVGFVLFAQRRECVILGVAEGEEAQFVNVLNPVESLNDILSRSNSDLVGIGRLNNNNNRGIIIIRAGLYARYMFYSSDE